jgi:hypothetical protein
MSNRTGRTYREKGSTTSDPSSSRAMQPGPDCRWPGLPRRRITSDRLGRYVLDRQEAGAAVATIQRELAVLRRGFRLVVRAVKVQRAPVCPTLAIQNSRKGVSRRRDVGEA